MLPILPEDWSDLGTEQQANITPDRRLHLRSHDAESGPPPCPGLGERSGCAEGVR
jgi:hypothetical protein